MTNHIKQRLWQTFYAAQWIIVVMFWLSQSRDLLQDGGMVNLMTALGRLAGLAAAVMILTQFFFMGRMPWLERVFGLDRLSRIHHTNGKWGIILLLLHPLLLITAGAEFTQRSLAEHYVWMIQNVDDIVQASLALWLFIAVVFTSLAIVRKKFRYESWYAVHLMSYAGVFFAFGHQIELGHTITSSNLFYGYWLTLYTIVFGSHFAFRFALPLYRYWKHTFIVDRVVRENYSTVSIYITGQHVEQFPVRAGQFMIFRFLSKSLWWQAHPFSLSMLPNGKELRITVKALGDFTSSLPNILPGTRVFIDGPYGVFTSLFATQPKSLLIAGGIGITPVRSLAEDLAQHHHDVALVYANRRAEDVVFKDELDQLTAKHHVTVHHLLSDGHAPFATAGRLDETTLKTLVPDVHDREVFLCGPGPMMDAVVRALTALGVPRMNIHFEKFSLA